MCLCVSRCLCLCVYRCAYLCVYRYACGSGRSYSLVVTPQVPSSLFSEAGSLSDLEVTGLAGLTGY